MSKQQKTIQTLDRNDCRWPIGDPQHDDFHFCGERRTAGRPYCEAHWRQAFQPSRPRSYPSIAGELARRAA